MVHGGSVGGPDGDLMESEDQESIHGQCLQLNLEAGEEQWWLEGHGAFQGRRGQRWSERTATCHKGRRAPHHAARESPAKDLGFSLRKTGSHRRVFSKKDGWMKLWIICILK